MQLPPRQNSPPKSLPARALGPKFSRLSRRIDHYPNFYKAAAAGAWPKSQVSRDKAIVITGMSSTLCDLVAVNALSRALPDSSGCYQAAVVFKRETHVELTVPLEYIRIESMIIRYHLNPLGIIPVIVEAIL